jgi:predicted exporter
MRQGRILAVTLWLLFVLACALVAGRSKFTADLSAFLPSHPSATQQLFVDQLQNGIASRLILIGIEGADAKTRAALSKETARRLRAATEFISVSNGEPIGVERDREFLFANRYRLSPAVTPERFTVAGLHDAIEDSIDLLASPAGLLIKPLLTRDPTGEALQLLDLFDNGARPRSSGGVWVSRDGTRAILLAHTRASGSDTDGQQRAVALIRQAFERAQKENGATAARLVMTGPGVFSVSSRDTIKHEVTRLSLLSTLIIVTLLLVVYRSFTALALGILPVATGILGGVAAVSLGFGTVHGVTLGFGITLIGEAVDYSIYLFVQAQRGATDQGREDTWMDTFWPTIRLGVMTSVIGFAALLFSGFPGLAQLGLYSTAGLIVAALVTRFVLPSLLPRRFHIRDVSRLGKVLMHTSRHAISLRWIGALLAVASCVVIYGHRHAVWNSDLAALSPVSAADRALDASLRKDLGAPDPRYLVIVSADGMDAALAAAEKAADRLQPLVDADVIAGYDSPSRYLPSLATQRMRQAAIPPRAELSERLHAAVAGLPIRAERLVDFLDDAETARTAQPLRRADLAGTSLALAADALLIKHGKRWSALLPLRAPLAGNAAGTIDPQRIRAALAGPGLSNAGFVDIKTELDQMYSGYLSEAVKLSLGGLIAILGLLFMVLRSPGRVLRVVLPLALAVLTVTAGLLASGYHLTILHLVGMLLIAAVGSNYALFFDRRSHAAAGGADTRTLASLLLANITTVIVFGLLAFSSVPVLRDIGTTVAPGVVLALLFAAILAERRTAASPSRIEGE